jgi:hypothetical protein
MSQRNEFRIFISSTFRDLQEEREHLVKKVFPEIRALCRERGVEFTEIDLRWGLTQEEATLGRVIRTCLEEIDRCRPYFIGLLGERYGWVPMFHDVQKDPELLARYPWVEDAAGEERSIMEMEFIHGALSDPEQVRGGAFFYLKENSDAGEDGARERLRELRDQVMGSGLPVHTFSEMEELGRQVFDDLRAAIDRHWPEGSAPSSLEMERRAHEAFAQSRRRAYIPNPANLRQLNGFADAEAPESNQRALVVHGDSGSGKSSLLAYWIDQYRRKHPGAFLVFHHIGASSSDGDHVAVMRHVIGEIRERFAIDEEVPARPEEIERSFPVWLGRLSAPGCEGMLLVIDAVNQLNESAQHLGWLPEFIQPKLKLIISATPGTSLEKARARGWRELEVHPLTVGEREAVIVRFLSEYHKGLNTAQTQRIAVAEQCASPLYLRVLLEELRLAPEHESLDDEIAGYLETGDIPMLFQRVLERMERDYGDDLVQLTMMFLCASRAGLSETELLGLMNFEPCLPGISSRTFTRLELSRFLLSVDYHLMRRDGLLAFFHDYLRRAVRERYVHIKEPEGAA